MTNDNESNSDLTKLDGLNKICGRTECHVTDPWCCVGCLGDEANDFLYMYEYGGETQ